MNLNETKIDRYFQKPRANVSPFRFDREVAFVFDDMVARSVPFYRQTNELIANIITNKKSLQPVIVDLGCSTGTLLCLINEKLSHLENDFSQASFYGLDQSKDMLLLAQKKINEKNIKNVTLVHDDLQTAILPNADFVIMNYTLQFTAIEERLQILEKIYQAIKPGGIFILSEKIKSHDPNKELLLTQLYYEFKRKNGYTNLEISQKQAALQGVLLPITPAEQILLLARAGFENTDIIFRYLNFITYFCQK